MKASIEGDLLTITPTTTDESLALAVWLSDFFGEGSKSELQMAVPEKDVQDFDEIVDAGSVRH